MALFVQGQQATSGPAVDIPLLDNGSYPARLLSIVDLGLQAGNSLYPEDKLQMCLTFELADEFLVDAEGNEIASEPRILEMDVTYKEDGYMDDRSTIHKVWTALNGFNTPIHELLGRPCMVAIAQGTSKKGKEYNKITSVSAMREKDASRLGDIVGKPFLFSLDKNATLEMFNQCSTLKGEYSQQSKIKQALNIWDEAPQLAEALKIEKIAPPKKEDFPDQEDEDDAINNLANTVEGDGGAIPSKPEEDEEDPFA